MKKWSVFSVFLKISECIFTKARHKISQEVTQRIDSMNKFKRSTAWPERKNQKRQLLFVHFNTVLSHSVRE